MTTIDNSAWDAGKAWKAGAASDDPAAFYAAICAGRKKGDPKTQEAYALPYRYSPSSAPNAAAVRNALSRLPQTEGLTNAAEAKAKLEGLLKQIQAGEKNRSGLVQEVREYREANSLDVPGGMARMVSAPAEMRGKFKKVGGRNVYEVEGYATVYNRGYEMWDRAGKYTEFMDSHALDVSLSQGPDVAFLVNHKGVTMARTRVGTGKSPTMQLSSDTNGLLVRAMLNADRTDVSDLAAAIDDGDVDEMSFAFMIENSAWNDDYTEFRISQADINRGDVSAVNYGANPFTSIQARASQWLNELEMLPPSVVREAIRRATRMDDFELLFRDAAAVLSERGRDRYEQAAEFNEEAAARAAHSDDDDLEGAELEAREESEPKAMTVDEARLRLRSLGNMRDYKNRLAESE